MLYVVVACSEVQMKDALMFMSGRVEVSLICVESEQTGKGHVNNPRCPMLYVIREDLASGVGSSIILP